ncbi:sensor domain-containing diguanylate cyclase [Deinococcus aquaticus]|uniref:GGDEF domain-containing protein n=1 Tax=Deinococcus aquaticus TaxID=328692 RepID=A0ABY7V7Y0_9DEIO|nr:GGDEF domain-containing protein [Deinococcus aquaticus]WDA60266.1 GGDEF domain-containing protein [Deinococcus aquaticus]
MPDFTAPTSDLTDAQALQLELQELQAAIAAELDPLTLSQHHRDAAYAAMDLGNPALAMTHAVTCLDIARSLEDVGVRARAHVTVALVMLDVYDDLGAWEHFREADALASAAGQARDVALVAVNASHYELERGRDRDATLRLLDLLDSPFARGLHLPGVSAPHTLEATFHINLVKAASRGTRLELLGADLAARVAGPLNTSVAALYGYRERPEGLPGPRWRPEVLESLTEWEWSRGNHGAATDLVDERVRLSGESGSPNLLGRALLDRSLLRGALGHDAAAIADAALASAAFRESGQDLLVTQAMQAQADARARLGEFREAFGVQRALTRQLETLYRAYFQQGAQLRQIERQVGEAEVRAAAFAEAALRDPLTGAPNRTAAMQRLEHLQERANMGQPSALALLDIDHFKRVNDRYGHAAGDAVLLRAVQVLTAGIREQDCLARFGGEEFLLILAGTPLNVARQVCDRLCVALASHDWSDVSPDLQVTASFGLARLRAGSDLRLVLRAADSAMYEAKAAGRNTVREAPDT